MGASFSRAATKVPKRPEALPWVGARTPRAPENLNVRQPLASETKNEAIEKDAADPQLLSRLTRLGPVKVDHHMQTISTGMLKRDADTKSGKEASFAQITSIQLPVGSLSDLLDARKSATSQEELSALATRYNMDVSDLECIARYVNTPTIEEDESRKTFVKDGVEHASAKAIWIDPSIALDSTRQK